MSLDHSWTCPQIDKLIDQMKTEVQDHIHDLVMENNPWLVDNVDLPQEFVQAINNAAECLSDTIEDLFEDARSCNEDMRSAADKQIEGLEEQISDLEEEVNNLEERQ